MNKRIRELAVEAGGGPSKWYTDPDVLEYFAELIVRDCRDMFVVDSPSWNLLNEKLEHFGVKE